MSALTAAQLRVLLSYPLSVDIISNLDTTNPAIPAPVLATTVVGSDGRSDGDDAGNNLSATDYVASA